MVKSPITHTDNVTLEQKIKVESLVDLYRAWIDFDVSKYFENLDHIELYRCQETGYCFYYPFSLSGDEHFYSHLQKFPWYYLESKWEYDVAAQLISKGTYLLEIGCARGEFLKKVQEKGAKGKGLELNSKAAEAAKLSGLDVSCELIEDHADKNLEVYDVVCCFEVLEHIVDIKGFLSASIKALKPGGRLIIGVPNNSSFIKHCRYSWAPNLPPHHVGLWHEVSLRNLSKIFPLSVNQVYFEPLTTYEDFYWGVQKNRLIRLLPKYNNFPTKVISRLLKISDQPIVSILKQLSGVIHGHSIVIEYTKN